MGVAGAALATVAAQLFASFLCFVTFALKMAILRFSREDWRMQTGEFALPLKISLPIGLQASIIAIGSIVLQKSSEWLWSGCGRRVRHRPKTGHHGDTADSFHRYRDGNLLQPKTTELGCICGFGQAHVSV